MPLEIKRLTTRQWGILDEGDSTVFTGTLSECRLWLDLHENVADTRQSPWWRCVLRSILRILTFSHFPRQDA